MIQGNMLPDAMLVALPADPRDVAWREDGWRIRTPASGGDALSGLDHSGKLIRDFCLRHRGEVREVQGSGYWKAFDGQLPRQVYNPQFDGNFIRGGTLAYGSSSSTEIRCATVFSLADLFFEFGEKYTAAELYEYYLSCRVIATRRTRGQRG